MLQRLNYRLRDERLNVHTCFDTVEPQGAVKLLRHACDERNQDDVVPLSNHWTPPRCTLPPGSRGFNENLPGAGNHRAGAAMNAAFNFAWASAWSVLSVME